VSYRMIFDAAAIVVQGGDEQRARAYTRPMSRPGELARAWRDSGLVDVVQDMVTIRMDYASFADFWAPAEGKDGPIAQYVGALGHAARVKLQDAVKLAYLDGEDDGPRSYAATAWVVKGKVPGGTGAQAGRWCGGSSQAVPQPQGVGRRRARRGVVEEAPAIGPCRPAPEFRGARLQPVVAVWRVVHAR